MGDSDWERGSEGSCASNCSRMCESSASHTGLVDEQEDSEESCSEFHDEDSEDDEYERPWDPKPWLHRHAEACRERDKLRDADQELDCWGMPLYMDSEGGAAGGLRNGRQWNRPEAGVCVCVRARGERVCRLRRCIV